MQYFAADYWQAGEHSSALMLQQVYHKRRRLPVLFACICSGRTDGGEEERLVRLLTEWFYEEGLFVCGKRGEKGISVAGDRLKKYMAGSVKRGNIALEDLRVAGVFCTGDFLLMFQQGDLPIRIINRRGQKTYMRELQLETAGSETMTFQESAIMPGVGILLATDGFCNFVSKGAVEESLDINQLHSQKQMGRRLKELGEMGEVLGGTDMGALLIFTGIVSSDL